MIELVLSDVDFDEDDLAHWVTWWWEDGEKSLDKSSIRYIWLSMLQGNVQGEMCKQDDDGNLATGWWKRRED